MTASTFGPEVASVTLLIPNDSAFNDTATKSGGWVSPPVIEFTDTGDTWTATLDPADNKVALFSEPRTVTAVRVNGEDWRLRDTATDEVIAAGRVSRR